MNKHEIFVALETLARKTRQLEDLYIDGEGEVTEETESLEGEIAAVKGLLSGDGLDELGRWLRSKQDAVAAAKAEKRMAEARVKAAEGSVDYVLSLIGTVLDQVGESVAKGAYYTFKRGVSTRKTVNQESIDATWLQAVTDATRADGLPECIGVVLKTTTGGLVDAGMGDLVEVSETPSVTFLKPKKAKEEAPAL